MDELRGKNATWRFDGENVLIQYRTGWRVYALLKALARCEVPVAAIDTVVFAPGADRKKGWELHLRLKDRADPFAAVGGLLPEKGRPFVLTGDAKTELIAEYYADQLTLSVNSLKESGGDPRSPEQFAVGLVPPLPLHIKTSEGSAAFDGSTVRLEWNDEASSRKAKKSRNEFALDGIRRVDWIPGATWNEGYLRVVTKDSGPASETKPSKDFHCLLSDGSEKDDAHTLLMAATVTAHLWASGDGHENGKALASGSGSQANGPAQLPAVPDSTDAQTVYDRIRELGRLHTEGLLTDQEFTTKKAELLDRL